MDYPTQWTEENQQLTRTFACKDFVDAVALVNLVAPIAEEMNHHPDIEIFGYSHVTITLTTHDAENTITEKDIKLADRINIILAGFPPSRE